MGKIVSLGEVVSDIYRGEEISAVELGFVARPGGAPANVAVAACRLGSEAAFVERVNHIQRPEGYRLVASFTDDDKYAAAVAGFRVGHYLAWGRILYCDDLSSRPAFRRHGHAGLLLDWLSQPEPLVGVRSA